MCCPCFNPRHPVTAGDRPENAMLPLGDCWNGDCLARPSEPFSPDAATLALCNLGYARDQCPRFPPKCPADAVRFSLVGDDGASLQIYYAIERQHYPLAHGRLAYGMESRSFAGPLPADTANFEAQARAYLASYRRRKEERRG